MYTQGGDKVAKLLNLGGKNMVTIPPEHIKNLGWQKGDELIFESNKKNGTITIRKI